jgi:NAD-dependent DNA ligase
MPDKPDDAFLNSVGSERIRARQVDELIGLARGLVADGKLNLEEVEFLRVWLEANAAITKQPLMVETLHGRLKEILADGAVDDEERRELFETLSNFSRPDVELGEVMKSTSLPLCNPAPTMTFKARRYCFTGTFMFGKRSACEAAVSDRGGFCGNLTKKTEFLVIGIYATESWKHSAFGNKILQASEWRAEGVPISIVSEEHWKKYL